MNDKKTNIYDSNHKKKEVFDIKETKPSRYLTTWAIDLTVKNLKPYVKIGCLKSAKSKSLRNTKTKFVFSFVGCNPVGFCAYRIEGDFLFVYEIHVQDCCRSQGIGTNMMNYVKEKMGLSQKIVLQVHKSNTKARDFYIKNGFVEDEIPVSKNYRSMIYLKMGHAEPSSHFT